MAGVCRRTYSVHSTYVFFVTRATISLFRVKPTTVHSTLVPIFYYFHSQHTMSLVVRDDRPAGEGDAPSSSSSSIVLDALPYVEPLDPSYEGYALSLIEEELRHSAAAGAGGGDEGEHHHPSLGRILSPRRTAAGPGGKEAREDFASRAPLAAAAYDALVSRRRAGGGGGGCEGGVEAVVAYERPDPMAGVDLDSAIRTMDREDLSSDLRASIASMKVRLESERMRHAALELHRHLETPARYAEYASLLENRYLDPTRQSTERQRLVVDGINGARMEEQTAAMRRLDGLARQRETLIDKNRRLGRALGTLEGEVGALRREAAAAAPMPDDGEGRNASGKTTTTTTTATIMEVAEITREN